MNKVIHVSRTKDETASKLEWVFSHFVLPVSSRSCSAARQAVQPPKDLEQIPSLQLQRLISFALLIDEERESDPGLLAESPRIPRIT